MGASAAEHEKLAVPLGQLIASRGLDLLTAVAARAVHDQRLEGFCGDRGAPVQSVRGAASSASYDLSCGRYVYT